MLYSVSRYGKSVILEKGGGWLVLIFPLVAINEDNSLGIGFSLSPAITSFHPIRRLLHAYYKNNYACKP